MSTAIFVAVALVAVGIVVDQLLRLRRWLNKSPPGQELQEPPSSGIDMKRDDHG